MEHDKSCPATYETLKTVFALNANQMVLKPPMTGKLEGNIRTSEHIADLMKNKKDSPLVKHKNLQHKREKRVKFTFKIENVF